MAIVADRSEKEKRADKRREVQQVLVNSLFVAGEFDLAGKVDNCCRRFPVYFCPNCGSPKSARVRARHCMVRLCPQCEHRRAVRLGAVVGKLFERMRRPKFLTLTIANVPSMDFSEQKKPRKSRRKNRETGETEVIEVPKNAWDDLGLFLTRMTHRAEWKRKVAGWVWTKEVTRGKEDEQVWCSCGGEIIEVRGGRRLADGTWVKEFLCESCGRGVDESDLPAAHEGFHPHIHLLVDSYYWDKHEISALWKKVTKGRGYIVRIRKAHEDTAKELVKYFCKSSEIFDDPWAVKQVWYASRNRRLAGAGGNCFDAMKELLAADDLSTDDAGCQCEECRERLEWLGEVGEDAVYLDINRGDWVLRPGVFDRLESTWCERLFKLGRGSP